jgi:hypothetical protein
MPRMLPASIFDGCPSPGEREMFATLKNSEGIDSWIVLHSLDLAQHIRQVSGEADFVVIVPSLGVLCIEVKACQSIKRDDSGWFYGREQSPHLKGPFRQASEAMHSIRNKVVRLRPNLSGVLFWSAVVFPYLDFNVQSNEWHEWQVIDARKLQARGLVDCIRQVLKSARGHLREKTGGSVLSIEGERPNAKESNDLAEILRPSFEVFTSPKNRSRKLKEELLAFTNEQYFALDALEGNARILFSGPAGTGKTLLAIEAARRSASVGRRVLLLCYNRLLSRWISDALHTTHPAVSVMTLHQFALAAAGIEVTEQQGNSDQFWREELPTLALNTVLLGDDAGNRRYDELVIDEAQDILTPLYLDLLDFSVVRGLADGRWRIFADFENQALYRTDEPEDAGQMLAERATSYSTVTLRNNCRNPPRIACLAHLLGRLSPNYSRVMRPDNGVEPELLFYRNIEHQQSLLFQHLEQFRREGFEPEDIVILSPRAGNSSLAGQISDPVWKARICPYETRRTGQVGFATIHAFKGLEAQVVIVTDVMTLDAHTSGDLFYVGVTRPVERLMVLMNESTKPSVISALQG